MLTPGKPKGIPKSFHRFNKIDKVNFKNEKEVDSLVFKMAAWDVLEDTKAYRSEHCAHDLYFTGYNWADISEGKR